MPKILFLLFARLLVMNEIYFSENIELGQLLGQHLPLWGFLSLSCEKECLLCLLMTQKSRLGDATYIS
jgi:hypothetical protein